MPWSGGGANLRGCPSLTPPPSGPPRLPWPRSRPGKALFCQRERSECAEKSHPALMRVHTALQRGGGLPGGRGRGARAGAAGGVCGGPEGPESPPVWLLIARTLSAVTEAGGSRLPSPEPATRRVTRKHGAAPLPRPPSPRSRLPPRTSSRPRGFCSSNALLSAWHHYASSRFSAASRVSFPFVFKVYRKGLLLSRALSLNQTCGGNGRQCRRGGAMGILAATDQSGVETSLAGFPATAFLPPPPLTDQPPRRRFSTERP